MQIIDKLNGDWLLSSEIHKLQAKLWRKARGDGVKVVLITSAVRGEGKSTTAAYLATALALHPDRTIMLVDLDFRVPSLNTHFQVEIKHPLSSVLKGECSPEDAIVRTSLPNLDLMLPEDDGSDPDLLLRTVPLTAMFDYLRQKYELVLVDVPALLPVADATVLLPLADGVILLAMAGVTTKPQLHRAREICVGMGANVLGLVIANLEEALPEHAGGYNYGYGYGYGYGTGKKNGKTASAHKGNGNGKSDR